MQRLHFLASLALLVLSLAAVSVRQARRDDAEAEPPMPTTGLLPASDGSRWFRTIKPFCNALEVESAFSQYPAPASLEGSGYAAGCFAIAGRIDRARQALMAVDPAERWRAAGIVFEIGHPIADAGDDRSAGPIMELVAEFWPNHYMALYHAGAAEFDLGQREAARRHLEAFLRTYQVDDGWRQSARDLLARLGRR